MDEYKPPQQLLLSPDAPPSWYVRFIAPRDCLPDVLRACDDLIASVSQRFPLPRRDAVIRAKALILAVGPLLPGGPSRVLLGPSVQGGVVATFYGDAVGSVTVTLLNNRTAIVIYSSGRDEARPGEGLAVEEMSHEDALWQVRDYFRET